MADSGNVNGFQDAQQALYVGIDICDNQSAGGRVGQNHAAFGNQGRKESFDFIRAGIF